MIVDIENWATILYWATAEDFIANIKWQHDLCNVKS